MSSDTVYMGGLTEERYVNPLTHGILMHAFKWAMDGVSDYLPPEQQGWLRREPGGVRGDVKQVRLQTKRLDVCTQPSDCAALSSIERC